MGKGVLLAGWIGLVGMMLGTTAALIANVVDVVQGNVVLAQDLGPITGPAGWLSFGVAGGILFWLFFYHIPAKDKQLDKKDENHAAALKAKDDAHAAALAAKDEAHALALEKKDARIQALAAAHSEAIAQVTREAQENAKADRQSFDANYREQHTWLRQISESTQRAVDVTSQAVQATRELTLAMRTQARLADALQSAEVPVWTKALDGTLMSWNAAAERVLGWPQGEVVGRSTYGTVIPRNRKEEADDVMRRIAAGESIQEYETERMHRDGRRILLRVVTSPIRDQSGRVVGASTIARELNNR